MFKLEFIIRNEINWSKLSKDGYWHKLLSEKSLHELTIVEFYWLKTLFPESVYLVIKLDEEKMKNNCKEFAEELAKYVFHPTRLQKLSQLYGFDMDEYLELI